MPSKSDHPNHPRRPSFFWWTLINILALAFAILSWTGCYFLFKFPDRPWNYSVLKKLDKLPELTFLESRNLPKVTTLPPEQIYKLIYERKDTEESSVTLPKFLSAETQQTLNLQLKRNYITNFKEPKNLNYVRGKWRILSIRELTKNDFISQGYALLAQALSIPADQEHSTNPEYLPVPVQLEIILPTAEGVEIPPNTEITTDNVFTLTRLPHAIAILHIARDGSPDEPITRISTIPLLDKPFPLTDESSIPLTLPRHINPKGLFPLFTAEDY